MAHELNARKITVIHGDVNGFLHGGMKFLIQGRAREARKAGKARKGEGRRASPPALVVPAENSSRMPKQQFSS